MNDCRPTLSADTGVEPLLKSVSANGRLDGVVLSMTLKQRFVNHTSKHMEVIYTFPLAWGAELLGMDVSLGERCLAAVVTSKQDAEKSYEQAIEDGDAPVMVEKSGNGLYTANIGSLLPGEELAISLQYVQLLALDQSRIRVCIPTTISPRYGDPVREGDLTSVQFAEPSLMADYGFHLSITVAENLNTARIYSPSHPISQQNQAGEVLVQLEGKAWLDRDFILILDQLKARSFAVCGPDTIAGDGCKAMIVSACPQLAPKADLPVQLKVLVDCSSSMAGDRIRQAKSALVALISSLNVSDSVSYNRFGSTVEFDLPLQHLEPKAIKTFRRAIERTEANLGGTEMAEALSALFDQPVTDPSEQGKSDVLLITDGDVWGAKHLVNLAQASGHRIYAIGVGSAPAESLLREMTESSGGACELVQPNEDMTAALTRLLNHVRNSVPLEAVSGADHLAIWSSGYPNRVTPGATLHSFYRLSQALPTALDLDVNGQKEESVEIIHIPEDWVARLVAAKQSAQSVDPEEAVELALMYQLVTDETNLILVSERDASDKSNGFPELAQIRPMVTASWAGLGGVSSRNPGVMFSRRSSESIKVLSEQMAFGHDDKSIPAVFRNSRKDMADIAEATESTDWINQEGELVIPEFLRRQEEPAPDVTWERIRQSKAFEAIKRWLGMDVQDQVSLIQAFNRLAPRYHNLRRALEALALTPLGQKFEDVVQQIRPLVRNEIQAWSVLLFALHETTDINHSIDDLALSWIRVEIDRIEPEARQEAIQHARQAKLARSLSD